MNEELMIVYLFAPYREKRKWKRKLTIDLGRKTNDGASYSLDRRLLETVIDADSDDRTCFVLSGKPQRL